MKRYRKPTAPFPLPQRRETTAQRIRRLERELAEHWHPPGEEAAIRADLHSLYSLLRRAAA